MSEELHGQYVWVEGIIAHGQQPKDFPKRARIYVHGIGTGTPKKYKLITEPDAAQPSEAAGVQFDAEKFYADLVGGRVVHESDGDAWPLMEGEARQIVDELKRRLQPLTPNAGERLDEIANKATESIVSFLREYTVVSQQAAILGHHAPALSGEIFSRVRGALAASTPAGPEDEIRNKLNGVDAHLILASKACLRGEHTDAFEQVSKAETKLHDLLEAMGAAKEAGGGSANSPTKS